MSNKTRCRWSEICSKTKFNFEILSPRPYFPSLQNKSHAFNAAISAKCTIEHDEPTELTIAEIQIVFIRKIKNRIGVAYQQSMDDKE
jgi:hypothetical protein